MRLLKPCAVLTAFFAFQTLAADPPAPADPPVANPAAPQAASALATAVVVSRTVPREYRLDGIVEAVNRSTVSAQTQGQVQEILFDVDDYVEKGTVVVRLKDTEHRARVAQATADLKSATAQVKQARDEHARFKGLFDKKNVSDSAMDKATAELAGAQAALDAAGARLAQAQEQLKYTEIRAPYSGILTERKVSEGEMASPGQPLVSGISLDTLRVTVDVPQSLIGPVRAGARALVYLPDDTPLESGAVTVFPYADAGSNTFKVRVDLPAAAAPGANRLFPGMFVKIGFVVGEKAELAVPQASVVHRSEVKGVYVVDASGRVHLRQVRLGRALAGDVVVLSGLTAGEQVALDPIAAGVLLKAQAAGRPVTGDHHD